MSLVITYKTLFEVNILHHYFLDDGNDLYDSLLPAEKEKIMSFYSFNSIFNIRPTGESAKSLRNHQCVFRNTLKGFKVWTKIKIDDDGNAIPFIKPDDDLKFTFNICLADQNFYNYTAFPLLNREGKICFFTNQASSEGNKTRDYPYLSKYPSVFGNKTKYASGDMLIDDTTAPVKLFVAKRMTISDPLTSGTDWHQESNSPLSTKPIHYVNENDLVAVTKAFLKNTKTEGNTVLFGQVEISHRSDDPSFNLLDDDGCLLKKSGELAPPVFELRFKNRATIWRYLGKDFSNKPETTDPQPLTKFGLIPVSITNSKDETVEGLPNPSVNMVRVEPDEENTAYNIYSEIYIN